MFFKNSVLFCFVFNFMAILMLLTERLGMSLADQEELCAYGLKLH